MITFQNDKEEQLWRETLLHWNGVVQEGFDMADKVVLAYRERCPKNSVGFVPKIGDPWPFNFCDVKPLSMPDIRIVEPTTGEEATKEENNDGE